MRLSFLRLLVAAAALAGAAQGQTNYTGNGASGFGGAVGGGILSLSDDGSTLTGTITRGPGNLSNQLVIYIDSVGGGFSNTGSFFDTQDGLRRAISGVNGGATARSLLSFPAGFQADYAIALGPDSDDAGGVWRLAAGGAGSLTFNGDANLTPLNNAGSSSFTFTISLASIGVTPGTGFRFVTTYTQGEFRSNESLGNGMPTGTADGLFNIGANPVTAPNFATYGTPVIPEPATFVWLAGGLGGMLWLRRRK